MRREPFVGARALGHAGRAEGVCAVRRRSFRIERHEFQVQDSWVGQAFTSVVTLFVGCSGSGKSTGFESLLYPLGLNSGKIMHAVRSCTQVRLVFRVGDTRWQATRPAVHRGGSVCFENLSDPTLGEVRRPVTRGRGGEQSASEFVMELLGIPLLGSGQGRVGLAEVERWLALRQSTIATAYLGGGSDAVRRLTGRVLLGLHDEHIDALQQRFQEAKAAHSQAKAAAAAMRAARQEAGLPGPMDLEATAQLWKQEHAAATERAQHAQAELSRHQRHVAELDRQRQQARAAQQSARRHTGAVEERMRQAQRQEGRLEGRLEGLRQQASVPQHCPQCNQVLQVDGLPEDHCQVCRQQDRLYAQRLADRAALLAEAEKALASARQACARLEGELARAQETEDAARDTVRTAEQAISDFTRSTLDPCRAAALTHEKDAAHLAGRLEQLQERIKEVGVLAALEAERDRLMEEKDQAHEVWKEAEKKLATELKQLVEQWSRHFLTRLKAVNPDVRHAHIDPETFLPHVDGLAFDDQAVAGGPQTLANLCAMLALRDVARAVPTVLLPLFFMVDSPLSGLGGQGLDGQMAERLLEQLADAAAVADTDGTPMQIIAAVNDPLPRPLAGVREIRLDRSNRYIPAQLEAEAA
ncbi:hypothetical protein ACQEWB_50395 [Streptomyces sp. CA-249302]|uniref:hypothetical protein n=1 Tax=Streptomyces sp. CA-249302 TaxID=3240058 RepID=UPI003D905E0C